MADATRRLPPSSLWRLSRYLLAACFIAAEEPDVPQPGRDGLARRVPLAAEQVGHRRGRISRRLVPAPVVQDVQADGGSLTGDLAAVTGARPMLLPAPALVSSPALRRALIKDPSIGDVMKSWQELDLALVGIGSLEPSPLLRQSGNALTEDELGELRGAGAVGDVCLRFFDADGRSIETPLSRRIMSVTPADLIRVPRRVGVAGGASKYRAIRAALRGGWVNVLVTDLDTARGLVEDAASQ
jgi:DNA-binding transcriptional regulator LsrR (DeoR family)